MSGQETPGVRCAYVRPVANLLFDGDIIGGGCNSGFQALNLAVLWGADRVIFTGLDMHGTHWHGKHKTPGLNNPGESMFRAAVMAFKRAAEQCRGLGVEVVNASPGSRVDAFPILEPAEVAPWLKGKLQTNFLTSGPTT